MNIIVIGAGPAGYSCAIALAQKGANVTIIESKNVGGICLNEGCIPTKSLLHQTKHNAADWNAIQEKKSNVVGMLTGGVQSLLQMNNVNLVKGVAKFVDANTIEVNGNKVTFDKAIIATGSSPAMPDFAMNNRNCIDSTEALAMAKLPKSMCIIGGGVIGCEMATVLNNAGVKVTIVEAAEDILLGFEKKHVYLLKKNMQKRGIDIYVGAKVTAVRDSGFTRSVAYEENGEAKTCACDKILVAVGRKANIEGLNLDDAGVSVENGIIKVDANFKTDADNIYAIGDCASRIKLAYWGSTQAKKLAKYLMSEDSIAMPADIPSCVFTHPEIAKVGKTEAELQGQNIKCAEFPFSASGKAHCIDEGEGYVKLIIDADSMVLLGAHIVGPMATELIGILVPLVMNHCHINMLTNSVFAHPTLSEAIAETADILMGESINFKS